MVWSTPKNHCALVVEVDVMFLKKVQSKGETVLIEFV